MRQGSNSFVARIKVWIGYHPLRMHYFSTLDRQFTKLEFEQHGAASGSITRRVHLYVHYGSQTIPEVSRAYIIIVLVRLTVQTASVEELV